MKLHKADTVQLQPETLLAYESYIREAEVCMDQAPHDFDVSSGRTHAQPWSGKRPIHVPLGLIHDWIGATRIPGTTIAQTLEVIQDYDNHKNIYKPEVIDSRLIERSGDDFKIYLRLLKKKVMTVVLDTEHDVHYSFVAVGHWSCRSYTTRISEVEGAGSRLPDTGYGFLWRLNSYWRFLERDNAVDVECRAISLTRDVPKGLVWVIDPIVKKLPRESLIATLDATRKAVSLRSGCAGPG